MMTRTPVFYQSFRCLGGRCPLTCCRDWEIVLDQEALDDYASAPEPLRGILADSLVQDCEGDVCFRLEEDGRCALLDGDGLCAIQRSWGEAHLCAHCGAYPRFLEEYGSLTECVQALSCPEAARLVMERGLFPLEEVDDGIASPPFEGVDETLLSGLVRARARAFDLLAQAEQPLWRRLSTLLTYAQALQERIDGGLPLDPPPPPPPAPAAPPEGLRPLAADLLALLARLEPLRPDWPALLRRRARTLTEQSGRDYLDLVRAYEAANPAWSLELERLADYFLFRHWPKVVNDDLLYGRTALTAAACLVLFHLDLLAWQERSGARERVLLWARFSREVEHLDENFDALVDTLSDSVRWPLAEALALARS